MTEHCACQNCDWTGGIAEVLPATDVFMRVEPGDIMPAGECPKCGALAMLEQDAAAGDLAEALRGLIARGLTFADAMREFVAEQDRQEPGLAAYYNAADQMNCVGEGECEIDTSGPAGGTMVSAGGDDGAYVLAWVWVDDETAGVAADEDESET